MLCNCGKLIKWKIDIKYQFKCWEIIKILKWTKKKESKVEAHAISCEIKEK